MRRSLAAWGTIGLVAGGVAGGAAPVATRAFADPAPASGLFMDGEAGEFVSGGRQLFFSNVVSEPRLPNGIGFTASNPVTGEHYDIDIASSTGAPIEVGTYDVETDVAVTPYLSVRGMGHGCGRVTGRFVVDEAVYDDEGNVERFAVRFDHLCEARKPSLFGQLLFDSTVPSRARVLSDASLDFGTAAPGESVVRDLAISNLGVADLHVSEVGVLVPTPGFSILSGQCATIPAGQSCLVRVVFTGSSKPGVTNNTLYMRDDFEPPGSLGRLVQLTGRTPDPSGEFTPLTPTRVLDTRDGTGGHLGPVPAGGSIDLRVVGVGGVPAAGVGSVVFNLTATAPTADTYVTAWPTGVQQPLISNVNVRAGETRPNLVTVAVGAQGQVSLYNNAGTTHLIADVVGFYATASGPSGSRFHSVTPTRLLDTRDGTGDVPVGPLGERSTLEFDVLSPAENTTGVDAVVLNVTVTEPTRAGYLTVAPADVETPLVSNLNFMPGQTIPNLVVVRLPESGVVTFFNSAGATHVIADIVGYYDQDRQNDFGRFVAVTPQRLVDTRTFEGGLGPDEYAFLDVANVGRLPAASSVVLNVTVTATTRSGYLTVFPGDECRIPIASNLNFVAGDTTPNLVIVGMSAGAGGECDDGYGTVDFYNSDGATDVVVDLFGYFR